MLLRIQYISVYIILLSSNIYTLSLFVKIREKSEYLYFYVDKSCKCKVLLNKW